MTIINKGDNVVQDYVNIYVIEQDFCPVKDYDKKVLRRYP